MRLNRLALIGTLGMLTWAGQASAINVVIDYTYDTTNFFGAGNPSGAAAGQQARDSLDAAASYFSDILTDTFTGIDTPPSYHSELFDGYTVWEWTAMFTHPTTGSVASIVNATIQPDEYRIYAGARSLGSMTAGRGGSGGYNVLVNPTGGFLQSEIDEMNQITDAFFSDVQTRGQASGFSRWGGSISFDNDGSTTWSYNHNAAPLSNTVDFYSVAIHELAHSLGFGGSEWQSLISGTSFTGAAALAEYGSYPPVSTDDFAHWDNDTMSTVYGTATAQEAAMDPDILDGTRKRFTALDAAGMADIGWDIVPPVLLLDGDPQRRRVRRAE